MQETPVSYHLPVQIPLVIGACNFGYYKKSLYWDFLLVDLEGFEPSTSSMPWKRSSQLS